MADGSLLIGKAECHARGLWKSAGRTATATLHFLISTRGGVRSGYSRLRAMAGGVRVPCDLCTPRGTGWLLSSLLTASVWILWLACTRRLPVSPPRPERGCFGWREVSEASASVFRNSLEKTHTFRAGRTTSSGLAWGGAGPPDTPRSPLGPNRCRCTAGLSRPQPALRPARLHEVLWSLLSEE